ncbi:hypothetical protein ISG33_07195 [Glaciecola sp. MH2013]|uniref:hypothetical protein n=1 Tax=Glaciecola sp. MH2013 TaxID=2785524 RepID=UPI00189C76A3|nr:hypothetical protein [Glaciecola sp. MH2013]MBF7073179.1 hypothetical protein [Glaciecola sp. MH2013]
MRVLFVLFALMSLSSCKLLHDSLINAEAEPEVVELKTTAYCSSPETMEVFQEYCKLDTWAEKIIQASSIAWPARIEMIEALGDDPKSLLEKILLIQSDDTPYRNRLRAQGWIEELQTFTDKGMTQILEVIVFQHSQQLLELESAITILSQVNSRQAKTIGAQEVQIEEKNKQIETQRKQVEQLLDIEASMVNENRSDNK